jgi:hypothetical protein
LPDKDLSLLRLDRAEYRWQVAVVAVHIAVFAVATLLTLSWQSRLKKND